MPTLKAVDMKVEGESPVKLILTYESKPVATKPNKKDKAERHQPE